jgi:hypothetical protein
MPTGRCNRMSRPLHVLGRCAGLCVQISTTRTRLSPGIQFGTGQVVQVPPYRGLYQCPILCLLTCTTLYRSVPPRCKPIHIWLPLVQGGTNWYNRVSCKWYKGWYKAFRFVPLGEVVRRLQQPHPGVGNTHRKPLLALGYTTQPWDLVH